MNGDLRLVRRYLRGEAAAFDRLYDRHGAALSRFAHHLLPRLADAEDLCQSAWLNALRSLPSYSGRSSFRAWLHGIALNLYRDQRRQPRLNTVELDPEQPSEGRGSDPEAAAERDEVVRQLRAALAGLEPEARAVILLGEIQGFTYQEIAETLGCPVGTIKSRVHYAMAALRVAMVQPPAGAPIRAPEEVPDAM